MMTRVSLELTWPDPTSVLQEDQTFGNKISISSTWQVLSEDEDTICMKALRHIWPNILNYSAFQTWHLMHVKDHREGCAFMLLWKYGCWINSQHCCLRKKNVIGTWIVLWREMFIIFVFVWLKWHSWKRDLLVDDRLWIQSLDGLLGFVFSSSFLLDSFLGVTMILRFVWLRKSCDIDHNDEDRSHERPEGIVTWIDN